MFCGEAIGEAAPPMLDASAMPRINAFDMSESTGRFRSMGWMMLKQSTGAATLEIHILKNIATNMFVMITVLALVPALLSTNVAIILAMLYFDRAAAIVKPPSNSIMTGVHIEAKTAFVASFASSLLYGFWSDLIIPSITTRKGMRRDVTNKGIGSVAHNKDTKTSMARQFCCSGFFMIGTKSRTRKMANITTRAKNVELNNHLGS